MCFVESFVSVATTYMRPQRVVVFFIICIYIYIYTYNAKVFAHLVSPWRSVYRFSLAYRLLVYIDNKIFVYRLCAVLGCLK